MKINFKIKEKLSEIIAEIMHSDKWYTLIKEEKEGIKCVSIKDPNFELEVSIEIRQHEIYIQAVQFDNYTYSICKKGNSVWCEYNGSGDKLLSHKLLPRITPKEKDLSWIISDDFNSSKDFETEDVLKKEILVKDNLRYDEFIKIGVSMPPIFD